MTTWWLSGGFDTKNLRYNRNYYGRRWAGWWDSCFEDDDKADTFSASRMWSALCMLRKSGECEGKIEAMMINLDGSCISILSWIEEVESVIRDSWKPKPRKKEGNWTWSGIKCMSHGQLLCVTWHLSLRHSKICRSIIQVDLCGFLKLRYDEARFLGLHECVGSVQQLIFR